MWGCESQHFKFGGKLPDPADPALDLTCDIDVIQSRHVHVASNDPFNIHLNLRLGKTSFKFIMYSILTTFTIITFLHDAKDERVFQAHLQDQKLTIQ